MATYKAIIVDDEASARNILSNLLEKFCPEVEVVALCEDLEEGVKEIKSKKPDLVFLDIEMPNYAGYEITKFIEHPDFEIIFITAYDHYAVKAFEVSAMDYLLKPIEIDRLQEAIQKFTTKTKTRTAALNYEVLKESLEKEEIQKIIIPFQGSQKVLHLKDMIAIEASESYSFISCTDGNRYMVSKNLKYFESLLESNKSFVRSHKSWIINTDHLENYSNSKLTLELTSGIIAKLSKYKKSEFEQLLKN